MSAHLSAIRRRNLHALRGTSSSRWLSEKLNRGESQVSQILGSRPIGNVLARHIERCFEKPTGWLDVPHGSDGNGFGQRLRTLRHQLGRTKTHVAALSGVEVAVIERIENEAVEWPEFPVAIRLCQALGADPHSMASDGQPRVFEDSTHPPALTDLIHLLQTKWTSGELPPEAIPTLQSLVEMISAGFTYSESADQ